MQILFYLWFPSVYYAKTKRTHDCSHESSSHYLYRYRLEPANVAEVLTVRQVCVLGIHTVSNLEETSVVNGGCALEGVEVVLLLHELESVDAVDVLLTLRVGLNGNALYAYSVVKTLLVKYYGKLDLATAGNVELRYIGSRYYLDSVPTLSNSLLPCSDFLSLSIVVAERAAKRLPNLL